MPHRKKTRVKSGGRSCSCGFWAQGDHRGASNDHRWIPSRRDRLQPFNQRLKSQAQRPQRLQSPKIRDEDLKGLKKAHLFATFSTRFEKANVKKLRPSLFSGRLFFGQIQTDPLPLELLAPLPGALWRLGRSLGTLRKSLRLGRENKKRMFIWVCLKRHQLSKCRLLVYTPF